MKSQGKGFSPLEVLAVMTIVGIIAAIVVPRVGGSEDLVDQQLRQHHKEVINQAVSRWYIDHQGSWPALDLSDIGQHAEYFPEGLPIDPVTGTGYSLNSTTHRVR
ncbi:MAG: type II secretion system protein [Planctomycetota bacterium]